MQHLVNLTTEHVVMYASDRKTILFIVPPDGTVAQYKQVLTPMGHKALQHITGGPSVPVVQLKYDQVLGLPDPSPGVTWITTDEVRMKVPHRMDVVSPAFPVTSKVKGIVMGHTAFQRNV